MCAPLGYHDGRTFNGSPIMSVPEKETPVPTRIVVHRQSRVLEIEYADGKLWRLGFEFLRVNSPSAEVRGHGAGQEVLQTGKREVGIDEVDPVGHYAIQPRFSDGHATGLYTWEYLYWLGENQKTLWDDYLARLREAGASRDPQPVAGAPSAASVPPAVAAPGPTAAVAPGPQAGMRDVSRPRH